MEKNNNYKKRWETLEILIKQNNFKVIAEIGVKEGLTVKYLLSCCDLEKYVLVDNVFNKKLEEELIGKPVEIRNMTSLEASKLYEDKMFDLIFIDADHQFNSVLEDILAWKPKVKQGGIICGHDYLKSGDMPYSQVTSAVKKSLGAVNLVSDEVIDSNAKKSLGIVNLVSDEGFNSNRCVWWKYVD